MPQGWHQHLHWGRMIFLALIFALAAGLLRQTGLLAQIIAVAHNAKLTPIGVMLLLETLYITTQGMILANLASHQLGHPLSTRDGILLYLTGHGANVTLPSAGFSGAAMFASLGPSVGLRRREALILHVLAYLVSFVAFALLVLLALIFVPDFSQLPRWMELTTLVFAAIILVSAWLAIHAVRPNSALGRYLNSVDRWMQRVTHRFGRPPTVTPARTAEPITDLLRDLHQRFIAPHNGLTVSLGLGILNHAVHTAILGLALAALGQPLPWPTLLTAYVVSVTFLVISITPSGVGIVEPLVAIILTAHGVPLASAVAGVLLFRGVVLWLPTLLGFGLLVRHVRQPEPAEPLPGPAARGIAVSVVIPAHNEAGLLPHVLTALQHQTFPGRYEVIVVDNASTDTTAVVARKFGARLLTERRKGVAWARATGFRAAQGELIASTDADTIVPPDWLTKIVHAFDRVPNAAAVTGGIELYSQSRKLAPLILFNLIGPVLRWTTWIFSGRSHLWGANFAVRRSVYHQSGGFRTDLRAGEDRELGQRLRRLGRMIFLGDLWVMTSARRFEGLSQLRVLQRLFRTYVLNFFWLSWFHRPHVNQLDDIRGKAHPLVPEKKQLARWQTIAEIVILATLVLGILAYAIFAPSSQLFGQIDWHRKTRQRVIALTFDDGPNEPYTSRILDILDENTVKATFFVVGQNVEIYPDSVRRMVAEGDVVGNHTYSHPDELLLGTPRALRAEINHDQQVIYATTGKIPHLFRPPHGRKLPWMLQTVRNDNLELIEWSDMTNDWRQPGASVIVRRIVSKARPGGIIVLHDGDRNRHGADRSQEVAALPLIIHELKAQGYTFVTVPELLNIPAYNNAETPTQS